MAFSEVQSNSKPNSTAKSSSDRHISTISTESTKVPDRVTLESIMTHG